MAFDIPSPFAWDQSFNVHNAKLNEQHVKLFELINNLDANRASAEHLKALLDYVVLHFKTEEEMFEAKGWAGAHDHKATHDKFVQDALALASVGDNEMHFIKNWLVHHIKGADFTYVDVLRD